MLSKLRKLLLALPLAVAPLCVPAHAQELSLSLGRRIGHGSISVHVGTPLRGRQAARGQHLRVWIPGHYETSCQQVWVPGCTRKEWVPARYATRVDGCGRRYQVLVCAGHWEVVQGIGHYERREVQVWVPGCWQTRGY